MAIKTDDFEVSISKDCVQIIKSPKYFRTINYQYLYIGNNSVTKLIISSYVDFHICREMPKGDMKIESRHGNIHPAHALLSGLIDNDIVIHESIMVICDKKYDIYNIKFSVSKDRPCGKNMSF